MKVHIHNRISTYFIEANEDYEFLTILKNVHV